MSNLENIINSLVKWVLILIIRVFNSTNISDKLSNKMTTYYLLG